MSLVVAFDDIKQEQINRNKGGGGAPASTNYRFFMASKETPDAPSAFLAQYPPDDRSTAHFHAVDQFQILVHGKGELGRHAVSPYYVHFARAYTPYGPLHADAESGWTFMTLRARFDAGAQRLPGALEKLRQVPNRKPWQVTARATFPKAGAGIAFQDMPGITDDRGLYVRSFTLAPNARAIAPAPTHGDGQYIVALDGSLMYERREQKAMTVIFVKPDERAFEIQSGPQGLQGLVLNFPQVAPRAADAKPAGTAGGYKKWQCVLCAFSYDEALGMPDEGIAPGTRWEDVPATWSCPDCAASKSDFEMVEI